MPSRLGQFFCQAWPSAPTWTATDVPDMTDKVVLVTGGTSGIGKETAKVLLQKNAKVYITAREATKAEYTRRQLETQTGRAPEVVVLDLGNLKSIKAGVEDFLQRETKLNVLFNNAGVMFPAVELATDDGYDLQFGVHVLGHFYLTKLLLPLLTATAHDQPIGTTRIVNTSSVAHIFGKLDFETFKDGEARRKNTTETLYSQSKMAQVILATELSRRFHTATGIVTTALNPGLVKTELQRHEPAPVKRIQETLFLKDVQYGALTQLYAGTSREGVELDGKYLIPWAKLGKLCAYSQNPELGTQLWDWLEAQVESI